MDNNLPGRAIIPRTPAMAGIDRHLPSAHECRLNPFLHNAAANLS
jgi:hypothetical protein